MALKKTPFQRTLANMTQQGTVDPANAEALTEAKKKQMGGAAANTMVTTPTDTPPQGATGGAGQMYPGNFKGPEDVSPTGGAINPTVSAGAGQVDNPTTIVSGTNTIEPMGGISKNYFMFGKPSAGFQSGMSAKDQSSWNAIGQKFAAGDQSWLTDTNAFRDNGNWGSFYDDNGNINGWLYAANGTGGYAPVFGGKVGETGYKSGSVFFSPDGKAYMMGPDGTLSQSGNVDWAPFGSYIGPRAGYQDSPFWAIENGQIKKYTTQTAPDSVLEDMGFYRTRDGLVLPIDRGYRLAKGVKTGQITPEQAALAETGGNGYPFGGGGNGGTYPYGGGGNGGGTGGGNGGTYPYGGGSDPTGNGGGNGSGGAQTTSFQDYLDQWDYGPPPEWNGSEYQTKENQHLQNAENIDWSESEYKQKALDLLEKSLQEYGGSDYEALVKDLLQKYGEEWGGSDYQKKQDEHTQNAENMKFNYNPETDPVWQALQKQYRREGDRATRQTMGQAAAMTGGVPSSYAATAAAQAGNNYAAQLSDRLPEVYQNAYNRYLKEYERELGLADQYAGYDQTMYERWNDQQGKNLDLADAYNLLGEQDRQAFKDRMDQLAGGADAYFKLDQDAYGRKLDEYDRETGLADTYNKLVGRDRDWYNEDRDRYETDKEFEYKRLRDARGDYENDRDFNEDVRRNNRDFNEDVRQFGMEYALRAQAQDFDQWYKQQGLSMDQAQMAFDQWYKQQGLSMEYEQMVFDQWYKKQVLGQNQQEIDNDYAYKQGVLGQNQQEIDFDQNYKTTAYQDEIARTDKELADQQALDRAQRYAALGNYGPLAELWGMTEDEVRRLFEGDGMAAGSAPSGGGGTGGYNDTPSPSPSPKAPTGGQYDETGKRAGTWKDSDGYTFNGYHPDGQPKSAGYNSTRSRIISRASAGASKTEITQELIRLVENRSITEYEANMILQDLGWKTSSAGTGRNTIGPNNVQMVQ